jgi:hypothetical protein
LGKVADSTSRSAVGTVPSANSPPERYLHGKATLAIGQGPLRLATIPAKSRRRVWLRYSACARR